MKRKIKWVLWNAVAALFIVWMVNQHSQSWDRVVEFLCWVYVPFCWLVCCAVVLMSALDKGPELVRVFNSDKYNGKVRSVSGWLSLAYDLGIAIFLVYNGFVVTGVLWITQQFPKVLMLGVLQFELDELKKKEEKTV